jgi:hypothetical protein
MNSLMGRWMLTVVPIVQMPTMVMLTVDAHSGAHSREAHHGDAYNGDAHNGDAHSGGAYNGNAHNGDVHSGGGHRVV